MNDGTSAPDDFDPFAQGELARTAPITPPQREIWSAIQLGGAEASCAYNEVVALRLSGALDEAALERALTALVNRHEALRTTFSPDGTTQLIGARGTLVPRKVDLSGEPDASAAFAALAAREVSIPFDLSAAPLGRAVLARLDAHTWQLLLLFHHIVCDGWSFGVLLGDLASLYDADGVDMLPPAESYAEYAEARSREDKGSDVQKTLAYWLAQYEGALPVLELPTDHARPALRTFRAGRVDHTLDAALVAALRTLAKQHGASLLQLTLTAFQTLLARLSDQWDIVVGMPTAGQVRSGRLGLVGHAVNFLPIRGQLAPDERFRDALARMKHQLNDALDHQDVTYGTLLENLPMQRDPSRVPLAPGCFNLDQPLHALAFTGLENRVESVPRTFETFELFANLADHKTTVVVELQYNRDLFEADTVAEWLEGYEVLLRGILAAPDTQLAKLPVLTDAARAQRAAWNETRIPFERDTPIHAFVERAVDAHPTRDAVIFDDERIAYGELDARANRLAHLLKRRGAGPDQIVGVCVRRSIDTLVAQLAVLKAGAAYLPLDPANPPERLRHMLDDAGARLIVTRADSADVLGDAPGERVLLDTQRAAIDAEPSTRPTVALSGGHLAYVIYTSGSTGKPKGVLVEHHNFASFLVAMRARLPLAEGGVFLCATSTGFDISLLEIFGALSHGFTVALYGGDERDDPEHTIPAIIARQGVTHFQCTPSQATIQLATEAGRASISQLSTLILGGEAVPADLARSLLTLLGEGRLFNGYGPTETTIYSTMYEVTRADTPIPIGTPVANTYAYVLDARGEPTLRGAIGELYLGGEGVTRGYHRRPELTAERFVRDPFASDPAARMYRTGDLVRLRKDGVLDYLGRNDHQVKIRGYRVELGEIEVALRTHADVREAVVVAREDRPGDKRLVAYLVCREAPTVPALKAHLSSLGLPDYMLPQRFVTLTKLPTTSSGKVDRRALPPPEGESALRVGAYIAPRTDSERRLCTLWQEVLGLSRVSVVDNFFDLGGHSVLAVRLAARIAAEFAIELPVSRLFQALTIEQLAIFVDASLLGTSASASDDDSRVEIEL